jgi:hypothetical protein
MNSHIVNADLRRDKFGRYLLADIYNLARNKGIKDPLTVMEFLNSSAMKLYEPKLEKHLGRKPVIGSAGGYYAEEVIALKYANQLSHTLEVELYQVFQNNCKEDPTMPEAIDTQMISADAFSAHSEVRVNSILSAIRMANDILANTDGIDKRSCSECTLTLLEVNLGVDMSAAKLLLKDPAKEVLDIPAKTPDVESEAVVADKSSLAAQSASEVGSPYTMLPSDIAQKLKLRQMVVNKALFDLGLQEKIANGTWRITERAKGIADMVKLGAKGGYNRRLMWHPEIVTVLADHFSRLNSKSAE